MSECENPKDWAPVPPLPDSNGDLGFGLMREAFAQAKRMRPDALHGETYVFAGKLASMRIVGHRLAKLVNLPFAHLRSEITPAATANLTIELWDQSESGVSCRIGSSRSDLDLHPSLKQSADGRYVSYQLQHSLICFDRFSGMLVGYASSAEDLSLYERGRPLHVPLGLWHKSQGMPLIHAGLVSKNCRGVLLAGPGGSGKSTSAITCAFAGFHYLSEDLISLQLLPGDVFAGHSLYSSAFIEPDHLRRFPLFNGHAIKGKYDFEMKHLVLLSEVPAVRFARTCKIHAVVLPRVMHRSEVRVRPASKVEALLTLAPSSLLVGEKSNGKQGFDAITRLVERVPCYWLELSDALEEISRVLERLLSEVAVVEI